MQDLNPEAQNLRVSIMESSQQVEQDVDLLERDIKMLSTALRRNQHTNKVLPMESFFRTIKHNEFTVQKTQKHVAYLRERFHHFLFSCFWDLISFFLFIFLE